MSRGLCNRRAPGSTTSPVGNSNRAVSNVFPFRPALVGVLLAALCFLTVDHTAVAQTSAAEDSEWDDRGDSSITHYEVLRRNLAVHAPGQFVTIDSNTGSQATGYRDDGVVPELGYVYRVKAVNQHGTSGQSNYVRADTPAAPSVAETEVGNGVRQVLPDSTHANLSALSVGGESVAGFDAETTTYQHGVASTVSRVTVAGVAADADATEAYSGTDADGVTDGHQVDLSVGSNVVTVTVTSSDGSTTRDYTVSVNRGSDAPFGWKAEDDFDTLEAAENIRARGIWSDGVTLWVGDDGPNKLFAYELASKQRDSDEDFNALHDARNRSIRGLWSDGTTMWVADYNDERIYAYARTTKQRDEDSDFIGLVDTEPKWSWGIWSDRTTMWIADPVFDGIYAYEQVDRGRDADKDIIPEQRDGNVRSADLWSDGTTMWVSDETKEKLFAYALDTGQRDSVRDFDDLEAGNASPAGIWSDGTTMWVSDRRAEKIYAYNMPGNPDLSALSLSAGTLTLMLSPTFHRVTTSYAVSVEHSVSTITVTATADDAGNATVEFLDADDMPLADADLVTDGPPGESRRG